jgi:hypothetical protein
MTSSRPDPWSAASAAGVLVGVGGAGVSVGAGVDVAVGGEVGVDFGLTFADESVGTVVGVFVFSTATAGRVAVALGVGVLVG